jgi:hypothetical protein
MDIGHGLVWRRGEKNMAVPIILLRWGEEKDFKIPWGVQTS